MAEVLELKRTAPQRTGYMAHRGRPIARVDLSRPGATQELGEVAADWLYQQCSDDGRRKLLAEHNLLAA